LEHRRKPASRKASRSVGQKVVAEKAIAKNSVAKNSAAVPLSLPNILDLISFGEITVGALDLAGCIATAADRDRTLAMLVRRRGETLTQLLTRLDQAIHKAISEEIYTDEISPCASPILCLPLKSTV
jgi:hypothetical protein